jgi:hypothetical protein
MSHGILSLADNSGMRESRMSNSSGDHQKYMKKSLVQASFKLLLPSGYIGTLIGTGGSTIKELSELTGAAVHVSDAGAFYPNTSERFCFISGSLKQVNYAQSLLWKMIGMLTEGESLGRRPSLTTRSPAQVVSGHAGEW